ncbi:hypothetical protein Daudx_1383 [Candidatus Desulforudis audaxviator]|nr:hypothetical protein Daudx_1383 [Candidatus Desulforudis audaxviator]
MHQEALRIRITLPPVEGRVNEALCCFLADLLEVAPIAVRMLFGRPGRRKGGVGGRAERRCGPACLRLALTPE